MMYFDNMDKTKKKAKSTKPKLMGSNVNVPENESTGVNRRMIAGNDTPRYKYHRFKRIAKHLKTKQYAYGIVKTTTK